MSYCKSFEEGVVTPVVRSQEQLVGDSTRQQLEPPIFNLAPDLNPFIHPPVVQNTQLNSDSVADVFFFVKGWQLLRCYGSRATVKAVSILRMTTYLRNGDFMMGIIGLILNWYRLVIYTTNYR